MMMESTDEAYETWKDNTPFFYDLLLTYILEWPSLTVEILPQLDCCAQEKDDDETYLNILLGTHTPTGETDSVLLLDVLVPNTLKAESKIFAAYNDYDGFGSQSSHDKFYLHNAVDHPYGEPNRLRAMPQQPTIVGSISSNGAVTVLNIKPQNVVEAENSAATLCRLVAHEKEGWALNWNPFEPGRLATGSDDHTICIWDIEKNKETIPSTCSKATENCITPLCFLKAHTAPVQDVVWHPTDPHILLSTGDDGTYRFWDLRCPQQLQLTHMPLNGPQQLNALAVNVWQPHLFATGGETKEVTLWDMRQTSKPLYQMIDGHQTCISRIAWGPSQQYIASCGTDRFVLLWDLSSIGKEVSDSEPEDGPPELTFTHGGHTGLVYDFAFSPNADTSMVVASVSQENELHLWKLNKTILDDASEEDETDDFEIE